MARKERKYHYIYKTTNIETGRYYYGMHSTDNLDDGYVGSGKRLWYSLEKYGKENHVIKIIEFQSNRKSLKEREKELINENTIRDPMCMNIKIGGEGGLDGLSEKSIQNIRKGASNFMTKLWKDPDFIDKHVRVSSERMRKRHQNGEVRYDTFTGKRHSEESKKKQSIAASKRIGEKNSQFGTCWVTRNGNNKKIKSNDLQAHINEGWIKGRKMKQIIQLFGSSNG